MSLATAKSGLSYLYVTNGGYPGDAGNYQGHVTAINLSDGTQKVFNALCSNQTVHFVDSRVTSGADCFPQTQSAIWARAGVIYNPLDDRIYMATGNGDFTPGSFLWGDTVFSLHPDGSGAANGNPLDTYTPTNFISLQNADLDLGSTAPALLPPAAGKFPHLAVQGGKDAVLRLLNLDNLSGQGQVGKTGGEVFSINLPVANDILTQPVVWVNPVGGRGLGHCQRWYGHGRAGVRGGRRREPRPAEPLDGRGRYFTDRGQWDPVHCEQRADLRA